MLNALLILIIYLVVIVAIVGLVQYVVRSVPIADPLGRIITVAAMVIGAIAAIIVLVQFAQIVAHGPLIAS